MCRRTCRRMSGIMSRRMGWNMSGRIYGSVGGRFVGWIGCMVRWGNGICCLGGRLGCLNGIGDRLCGRLGDRFGSVLNRGMLDGRLGDRIVGRFVGRRDSRLRGGGLDGRLFSRHCNRLCCRFIGVGGRLGSRFVDKYGGWVRHGRLSRVKLSELVCRLSGGGVGLRPGCGLLGLGQFWKTYTTI
jgi:hypothetical protein